MLLSETPFAFLSGDCCRFFGPEAGADLFARTERRYQALLDTVDDRGSAVFRAHLRDNLLPPMAFYLTLREHGMDQKDALSSVRHETQQAAGAKGARMRRLGRLPGAYGLFRRSVRRVLAKNYPAAGWDTVWVRCDAREIHFDLRRCVYHELTQAMGCPELCCVYCENDEIVFSGLAPRIRFQRGGTLASGTDQCDFHFYRG